MPVERSCGAVVYTRCQGEIRYVIIRTPDGFYGFPKGHMEPGETEVQTALREIQEETGLSVRLTDGFQTTDSYPLAREGRPDTIKHVTFFLAEYENQPLRAQPGEVAAISLMSPEEALSVFRYESSKRILRQAHAFLTGENM